MRVLVISGRAARQPWTHGGLAARICSGLASRGHAITLACQSLDDPALFAACRQTTAFAPFDQTATDWPHGFPAWARGRRRAHAHDVSLSLSRVAAADVWLPLEPSGRAFAYRLWHTHGIKSLAIAGARHNGALRAWAADAFFGAPRTTDVNPIRRVIAVGRASGEAARLLHTVRGLGEGVVRAEPFSMVEPRDAAAVAALRHQTRGLLRIEPDRLVVLVSAPLPVGTTLDSLLLGVAERAARDPPRAPVLLALAKDCVALHTRAIRCGAASHTRILGLTERIDAALAAADIVALPHKSEGTVFESGGLGRLAAEALCSGRPLLAVSGASGYELARLRSASQDEPGIVIDVPSASAWTRALSQAADEQWRTRAAAAGREVGLPLTFDHFLSTIDETLDSAAKERSDGGTPR